MPLSSTQACCFSLDFHFKSAQTLFLIEGPAFSPSTRDDAWLIRSIQAARRSFRVFFSTASAAPWMIRTASSSSRDSPHCLHTQAGTDSKYNWNPFRSTRKEVCPFSSIP